MGTKIHFDWPVTGNTLYFTVEKDDNTIWSVSGSSFGTRVVASWSNYVVTMSESPASSYHYFGTFPSLSLGEDYIVRIRYQAGGSPSVGDPVVGEYLLAWDGSSLDRGVNVTRIDDSISAATNLKQSCLSLQVASVAAAAGTANSSSAFDTNLAQENSNYYGDNDGGLIIVFISGTVNQFQSRRVIASSSVGANTRLTLEAALDATPTDADTFVILGRITELS